MNNLKLRINPITAFFLISVAFIYDSAKLLITLVTFGLATIVSDPIIDFWSMLTFFTWFKLLNVSFFEPKKALTFGLASFLSAIPYLGDFFEWTISVIIIIAITYAEDVAGAVSPATAKAMAAVTNPTSLAKK